ncbi:MAG: ABC transporter ATP-binding protein [Clostridium argentinense]|nr:ABC transporter ATP-binding protein [Clostridium argentinense]
MNKNVKNILSLNIELIKYKPMLFLSNFIIWLLISLLPLISSIVVKKAFNVLSIGLFKEYFLLGIILFLLGAINGILIKYGGIVDTASRFYCGQLAKKNFISKLIINKKIKIKSVGNIIDIIESDLSTIEELISCEIDLLCKIIFFIIALIILLNINFKITVYGLIPLIMLSNIIWLLGNKYKKKYELKRKYNLNYTMFLTEIINNREAIQFLSEKENIISTLSKRCDLREKYSINNNIFCKIADSGITFINNLSVGLLLFLSIDYFNNSSLSIGDFTLFINYFTYGFVYLEVFNEVFSNLKYCEDALIRISNILKTNFNNTVRILGNKLDIENYYVKNYKNSSALLKFKNFKLSYKDEYHNIEINKNQLIGLSGKNGSGKSRFINCILGYSKFEGYIYYKNKDITKNNCIFSYIPQETYFFNETIENNINVFKENIDIEESCKVANLKDNIGNWDIYSNKLIGVNAKQLSEGQRQRLAIARGIATKSDLIIIDDGFSFLDKDNINSILKNLMKCGKTILIATNDPNILNLCDKILYFDNLKIVKYKEN